LTVTLRRSKTDQEGAGRKIGIPYGSYPWTCPVRTVHTCLELAGISEGAKQAGCDAFVTKPCLPEDLVREIRRVLDQPSRIRRSAKYAKTSS